MLSGLDRLHFEGMVHRDVKPFNVMLAEDEGGTGTVKLIDFGLSQAARGKTRPGTRAWWSARPITPRPSRRRTRTAADARCGRLFRGRDPVPDAHRPAPRRGKSTARRSICEVHGDLDCRDGTTVLRGGALAPDPARPLPGRHGHDPRRSTGSKADWRWPEGRGLFGRGPAVRAGAPRAGLAAARSEPVKVGGRGGPAPISTWTSCGGPGSTGSPGSRVRATARCATRLTGLAWEREGSRYPLTWERAARPRDGG